jgi:membrane protein DedA with SNARE-associated domain
MNTDEPSTTTGALSARRVAAHRLLAGFAGVAFTTAAGSVGVLAAYYPLRHASFALQWLLVLALMTLESAAVHLPSEVILPVGGWLVVRQHDLGVMGVLSVGLVAACGNTMGSGLLYALGRAGGRPLVRRFGRYFLVHEDDIDKAERALRQRHVVALFATRVLPVVRTYAGFCAGTLRLPLRSFLVTTFVGSVVWCVPFVALGAVLGDNWDAIKGPAKLAGFVVVGLMVALLVVLTLRQLRRGAS